MATTNTTASASENVDSAKFSEQKILDARMEYDQLLTTARTIEQMWWVDVGAFFAVNTLLATALGFSCSSVVTSNLNLNQSFIKLLQFLIPITGIFFSFAASYTAIALRKMTRCTTERGIELEEILFSKIFSILIAHSNSTPWLTICASSLFGFMWIATIFVNK